MSKQSESFVQFCIQIYWHVRSRHAWIYVQAQVPGSWQLTQFHNHYQGTKPFSYIEFPSRLLNNINNIVLPNVKALLWLVFGTSSNQTRSHGGAFGGSSPPNYFCAPPNFLVPRKICFKNMIKTKIVPPLKIYFAPPNIKTWLQAWFAPGP